MKMQSDIVITIATLLCHYGWQMSALLLLVNGIPTLTVNVPQVSVNDIMVSNQAAAAVAMSVLHALGTGPEF